MSVIVSVVGGSSVVSSKELMAAKGGKPVRIKAIRGGKYVLAEGEQRIGPENITVKRVGKNLLVALEGTKPEHAELIIEDFFGSEGQLVGLAEDGEYHEYIAVDGEQASAAAALYDGSTSPLALGTAVIGGIASALMTAPVGILPYVLAGLGVAAAGVAIERHNDDDSKPQPADTTPPENNGIGSVIDDKDGGRTELKDGASTNDDTPTLVGGGQEPGDTVTIIDNGKVIGEVIVDDKGQWSFTPEKGLGEGEHVLEVIVTDPAGNASKPSDDFTIIVDTTAPAKPVIGSVMDDQGAVVGPVAKGGSTDDTLPTLNGTAEPGTVVHIYDNGRLLGSASVDGKGAWSFTPSTPLGEGEHVFTVTCSDAAGNTSPLSDGHLIVVDTSAPGKPNGADSMLWDDEGPGVGEIKPGDTTDDRTPTFSGKGEPGATVVIQDNGKEIGRVPVGDDGKWSFTPDTPLADGAHSLDYYVVDGAGNAGQPSDPIEFVVDTSALSVRIDGVTDNVGSMTGPVKSGGVTDDATPTVHGSATPGATVEIHANGVLLGKTTVGADGKWSYTPVTALVDGSYAIKAVVVAATGASQSSTEFVIEVDATAPDKPSIGSVYDDQGEVTGNLTSGQVTDDAKPELKGTGEPNSTIIVKDNGVEIGRAPVDADGNWSFVPGTPLLQGEHPLTVVNMDAAGNESQPSDAFVVNVGSSAAPAVPSVTGVIDDVGAVQGNLQKNAITDDARPTITGTAQPGMTISVYDNGKLLGTAQVNAKGEWSFTPTTALADGPHNLTAKATNAMGNSSPETGPYPIVVDTAAPAKPGSGDATLTDNEGSITGEIKPGDKTDDSTPTFAGKTEPGAEVVIYDNGNEIGRVTADPEGNWTFTPTVPLVDGDHSLSYEVVDQAGNVSEPSDPLGFVVDTRDVTVRIDGATDNAGKVQGAISAGGVTDDATPTLHGQATPGGTVKIYDGGVLVGQTTADAEGKWSLELPVALVAGPHSLTATVTTAAGGESAPTPPFTLTVDLSAPNKPVIGSVEDDVGSVQGAIGQGKTTDDTTPTLKGAAEAGSTVHVYDNGSLLGSVVAGSNGVWNYTPTTPLNNGPHSFTVTSEDKAGNVSVPSDAHLVIVDTVPPGKPSIESVMDDEGGKQGSLTSGDLTDDAKPELSGKAEPNGTVIIKDNGEEIGRAPVDANGDWTFTPNLPLGNGLHELTVEAIDAAGNVGQPSAPFVVDVLNDGAPAVPSITSVMDDVGAIKGNLQKTDVTDDARPTINGTAEPGVTVSIYSNGTLLGTVLANAKGEWSFTPTTDLADGLHNITAKATNSLGNDSAETGHYPITVDTLAPGKPSASDADLVDNEGSIQGTITNGSITDDSTPTFSGSNAEPNATVVIHDNGKEIGRVPTDAIGNWTFTPAPALVDGAHSMSYQVIDKAGNVGEKSDPISFTVDSSAVTVRIEGATDNAGGVTGELANGGVTDDATPTLHGKATVGGTVKIYDGNNVLLGETIANAEGKWSFTPATPLPEGAVTLYATVTTGASEESEKTPAFNLILDMTAPLKPIIEKVEDDVGNPQGVLANGQSTDDTTPTLSGKAEAGSTVRIYDNGSLLGSVVVDGAGNWNFTPTTPLNNGPHSFTVTSVDPAGNVSVPSDAYAVTVDTVAPGKPAIGSVYDDQGGSTGNLVSGDETDDTRPELKGTGEPNSTIIVKDNGVEIGRVPVDANGNWSFVPTAPLADGEHGLTVVNVDAAGNESRPSDPFVVIVDGSGGGKPEITAVMDDQGPKQGLVNAGESTDDVKPRISGTAKPNSTVSIWDNNVKIGQVQADAAGNWTFTPDAALQEGSHSIHVTAVDALGSEAEPSAPFAFEVNTGTPETPRISNIRDDVGEYQGIQRSGGHTDDTRPTVTGTGMAGDTIEVRVDGVAIGRGVVGADGRWSVTSSFDIAEGLHMFTAVAVSPSGVESALSNSYELTIDTTPPESPVVVSVVDNAGSWKGELENGDFTDDRTPTFHGKAEPNTTLLVYINGDEVGFAAVDADGNWTYSPDPLTYGEYIFTFQAVDKAMNMGAWSEDWYVYVGASSRSVASEPGEEGMPHLQDILVDADAGLLVQPALTEPGQADAGMDVSQVSVALQQVWANADAGMQVGTGVIAKMEDLHVIESPLLG